MGKPVLIFAWTNTGNYPVGVYPWSNRSLAVAPAGTYFTPAVIPPAEEFNFILGEISDDLTTLAAFTGQSPALNWRPEGVATTYAVGLHVDAAAWDGFKSVWITANSLDSGSPVVKIFVSYGQDGVVAGTWAQIGSSITPANNPLYMAVGADASIPGDYWFSFTDNASPPNTVEIYYAHAGSWSQVYTQTAGSTNSFYGTAMTVLNGYQIVAVAGDTTQASTILTTPDHGVTWTVSAVMAMGASGATWHMKTNGAQVVALPSSSGAAHSGYFSNDGHTFVATTTTFSSLVGPGYSVEGLAWTEDVAGACWLAAVINGSGFTKYLRSSDGNIWTLQSGGITAKVAVYGMASCGSLLVCSLADASSAGPSGSIFSPDGGITWYFDQAILTTNLATGAPDYQPSRVVGSGQSFMLFNSLWVRFSDWSGLPALSL